jgi:hypothetical protein
MWSVIATPPHAQNPMCRGANPIATQAYGTNFRIKSEFSLDPLILIA